MTEQQLIELATETPFSIREIKSAYNNIITAISKAYPSRLNADKLLIDSIELARRNQVPLYKVIDSLCAGIGVLTTSNESLRAVMDASKKLASLFKPAKPTTKRI